MTATTSETEVHNEEPMQQLLRQIVQYLVDDQDAVEVDCLEKDGVVTLNVHVAPSDTGKLIGKQGRTARSLRTIISAAGMKLHHRYALNIEEADVDFPDIA